MRSRCESCGAASMYMTVEQAAKELQIGRTLAYLLAGEYESTNGASGMPVKRVGKLLRVLRSDLEAWAHAPAEYSNVVDTTSPTTTLSSVPSPVSKARVRRSASTVEQPALFSA